MIKKVARTGDVISSLRCAYSKIRVRKCSGETHGDVPSQEVH